MDEPTIAQQIAASGELLKLYRWYKKRGRKAEQVELIRAAGNVWVTLARSWFGVTQFELVQRRGPNGGIGKKTPAVRARWLAVQLMHRHDFSFPDIGVVLHTDHTSAVLAFHRFDNKPMPDWAIGALEWIGKVLNNGNV